MDAKPISFIGGGNMARCLIGGLLSDGFPAEHIGVTDIDETRLNALHSQFGIRIGHDNSAMLAGAETVVLAVKPQVLRAVATELRAEIQTRRPLVVSIAAGIRTDALARWLGDDTEIVRAMPNTPALVGSGATGLYAVPGVSESQREQAEAILRAVGLTVWLQNEAQMDVLTALSGSGPAYFFLFMEQLQTAAVHLGMPAEMAQLLTVQTAFGAAKMALESSLDPVRLRTQVTSPGGTTEQAIKVFQDLDSESIVRQAVAAARRRSEELAHAFGDD